MKQTATVTIDGRPVPVSGERNLLELIRKAGVDLPTFCYHSELSVYGACRLCIVDIEGRGIQGACSTPPEAGMKIRTMTEEIREIRKISIELLLANHEQACPTCIRSRNCQLQTLARQLGIQRVRFKSVHAPEPIDDSSPSLIRDPNKCVLCGDCVRVCSEIQSVGAIDFAHRGHDAAVLPAFGKGLGEVECVNCGQCAAVCPTGALTPKPEIDDVWKALHDPERVVIAQVAPAVRVAIGEVFGLAPGEISSGQLVAALKRLGFNQVYDTSFAADLTVIEEGTEFLNRTMCGERLPQFTSCCPAWVKFAEQYHPELLPNLSTCRSPQQMFGSLLKDVLPQRTGVHRSALSVVSIMPCTAKKFEARREEFAGDVDHVLTTVELARMIASTGMRFTDLEPENFDMPFGFTTGAGVLFGNSGGVTEAVLRFAADKIAPGQPIRVDSEQVHGASGLREATVEAGGKKLRIAIVHGLRNARTIADQVKAGTCEYDLIEVMACPGGCIGGAGQPISSLNGRSRAMRASGIYQIDSGLQLRRSQDNMFVSECYAKFLGEVGKGQAHKLLHTTYHSRRRTRDEEISVMNGSAQDKILVEVCLGTSCFLRGSEALLRGLVREAEEHGIEKLVDIRGSFCFERCDRGPTVTVAGASFQQCTLEQAREAMFTAVETVRDDHGAVVRSGNSRDGVSNENGNGLVH
ncbi:MAG TPA: [FeFe] hydrogenase, group A [Bryobacteraceae bacterium]|nr:[FeFe] hydrogenase, group A [Bryobacteraceae bacterium]